MKQFTITNSDNTKMRVELIRYFKFKNDCFLIYSIGEIDEKGYKKLYLVRIMEELGFPVVQTIKNDSDWANMQGIVKKVLKELKRNKKKLTEDLDYREIDGIKIVEPRFFKLDPKLVDILSSNYMEGDDSVNTELENSSQIEQNVSIEQINNDMVSSEPLQSTDETIKQEELKPIEINNSQPTEIDQVDEEIQPVEIEPAYEDVPQYENVTSAQNDFVPEPVVPVEPVSEDEVTAQMNQVNEEVQPVEIEPAYEDVLQYENVTSAQNVFVPEPVIPVEPVNQVEQEELKPIVDEPILADDVTSINQPVNSVENQEVTEEPVVSEIQPIINKPVDESEISDGVNYKELYFALKADNDATNELLTTVLAELDRYKAKYGELED